MMHAIKTSSDALIYIQHFLKIGSAIQMLMGGHIQTHTQRPDLISLLLAF
jgi:hypothetical protein